MTHTTDPADPLPLFDPRPLAKAIVREIVHDPEVASMIAEIVVAQPKTPALLKGKEIAERLGVSAATITLLKRQGLPHLIVGMEARYDETECIAWLRARQAKGAAQ